VTTPADGHTVEFTDTAQVQLRAIARHAIYAHRGQVVAAAARQLITRLKSEPFTLGEPLYDLRAIRIHVRRVALNPLYLEYGVHFDHPFVVVRFVTGLGNDAV
jgi:hypothetical protein